MRRKLLSILALLCLTVTSAWAQTYTWSGTTLSDIEAYKEFGFLIHSGNTNIGGSGINVTWTGGANGEGWNGTNIIDNGNGGTLTFEYQGTDKLISSIVINASSIFYLMGMYSVWNDDSYSLKWNHSYQKTVTLSGNEKLEVSGISSVVITLCPIVTANYDGVGYYWATYYNSTTSGFTADTNTTVFQAALSGTTLTLTAVPNREIPSGKAVILKSPVSNVLLTPATTTQTLSGNVLQGTTAAMNGSAGNIYVLNKGTNGVGFYKLKATGTLAAGKAYLVGPASAPELDYLEFTYGDGNTTEITTTNFTDYTDKSGAWYSLDGRRIANDQEPTAKGLYIHNGKKVIIK